MELLTLILKVRGGTDLLQVLGRGLVPLSRHGNTPKRSITFPVWAHEFGNG